MSYEEVIDAAQKLSAAERRLVMEMMELSLLTEEEWKAIDKAHLAEIHRREQEMLDNPALACDAFEVLNELEKRLRR